MSASVARTALRLSLTRRQASRFEPNNHCMMSPAQSTVWRTKWGTPLNRIDLDGSPEGSISFDPLLSLAANEEFVSRGSFLGKGRTLEDVARYVAHPRGWLDARALELVGEFVQVCCARLRWCVCFAELVSCKNGVGYAYDEVPIRAKPSHDAVSSRQRFL